MSAPTKIMKIERHIKTNYGIGETFTSSQIVEDLAIDKRFCLNSCSVGNILKRLDYITPVGSKNGAYIYRRIR